MQLKMVPFRLNIKKKTDNTAYNYVLKDVKDFIQKIESMSENINLSLSEDFFESESPAMYAKMLINTENPDKNKEFVAEIKERISNLKEVIREMGEKEQKLKMLMTYKRLLKKFLITIKKLKNFFSLSQKLIKEN